MNLTDSPSTMDLPEAPAISSIAFLVDPAAALAAADRLYAAPGSGLRYSGWHGRTVSRRGTGHADTAGTLEDGVEQDDFEEAASELH